jgi:hypothetical protein
MEGLYIILFPHRFKQSTRDWQYQVLAFYALVVEQAFLLSIILYSVYDSGCNCLLLSCAVLTQESHGEERLTRGPQVSVHAWHADNAVFGCSRSTEACFGPETVPFTPQFSK